MFLHGQFNVKYSRISQYELLEMSFLIPANAILNVRIPGKSNSYIVVKDYNHVQGTTEIIHIFPEINVILYINI